MKKGIVDLLLEYQQENGELSKVINCPEAEAYHEVSNRIFQEGSEELRAKIGELEEKMQLLDSVYIERAYKQGVKDGIKLSNEMKALS